MTRRFGTVAVIGLMASALAAGCASGSATPTDPASTLRPGAASQSLADGAKSSGTTQWLSYHAVQSRTAAVASDDGLASARKRWSAKLGAAVYGQPLVYRGRIYAATETDRVVALRPSNGHVIWSRRVGTPLTDATHYTGCGDISPLGITSTPVIDTKHRQIDVVGEVLRSGNVRHRLFRLNLSNGKVVRSESVDPPLPSGERAANLLQRASLALANGRVYIPYGGNDGDCGSYHGWVVSVRTTGGPALRSFEVDPGGQGGAIWEAGGAPAVDGKGDVYVSTGNSNPFPSGHSDPGRYAESVVKLSPTLRVLASFKDPEAGGDADLATGNPVLLPGGKVFSVGKTDIAYILRQSNLHKVAAISGVCGSDPDGGPAYDAATGKIFVPCRSGGLQVIDVKHNRLSGKLSGPNSGPILVGQQLWAAAYNGGELYDFNARTGRLLHTMSAGDVPNFATPSTAGGRLLIGTTDGVAAFR